GTGAAVCLLSIARKYKMLSESDGAPVALAVHAHFGIPIHKSIDFLLTHPVGTADLQFGFDGIVSKRLGGIAELYWNVGYRHINQPAHVSVFRLGKELPLGFGFTRSEEHTSELQSRVDLVCRLLLEKKNIVRRNVKMEARLIEELLDVTRNAKGKLQLSCVSICVHQTLHRADEICRVEMTA